MFIPKANFYLKNISSTEPTLISLQVKFNGHRAVMSTGEKILPTKWDFSEQRGVGRENTELNFWLDKIEGEVKSIFRNYNIDNVIPDSQLFLENLKLKLDNTPLTPKVETKVTLFSFIEKYIEEEKVIKKTETIKAHKTTFNHLRNYADLYNKGLDFENIDMEFYYSFSDYVATDLSNSKNTVAKHIKTLKTFLREATERGYNKNMTFQTKSFKKITEVVDMAVALTPTTIDDKILAAAKSYIARAAADLLIVYNILKGSETPEEVLRKLTNYVSGLTDDQKAIFYVQLSGKVMQVLADGKVTLAEAITITQYIFKKYHQDK